MLEMAPKNQQWHRCPASSISSSLTAVSCPFIQRFGIPNQSHTALHVQNVFAPPLPELPVLLQPFFPAIKTSAKSSCVFYSGEVCDLVASETEPSKNEEGRFHPPATQIRFIMIHVSRLKLAFHDLLAPSKSSVAFLTSDSSFTSFTVERLRKS